ncbi:MAG: DsbC family protein [Nitrosomonadales bacterium]|nr:DsbC family protein [Nitrosomonadales bacterium]
MKKSPLLALCALFLFVLSPAAQAGEKDIRQTLQSRFPNIGKLEHVVKTPYSGLYEIIIDDQLYYIDAQGQYLFEGSVIDTKTRRDLSDERRKKLFAVDFDSLPLDLAVKRVKGNGKRRMAYFTDPNCTYCKKLEKELTKVSDVTLYIFLFPLFEGSDTMVRNVYCAKDPIKAWDGWMQNGIAPAAADCKTPTEQVKALGRKLRVSGTPNLIFANGVQSPGYMPAEELEKRLNEPAGK